MGEQNISRSGFTRTDLLVVLGCVVFLSVLWIRPSLAGFTPRADEAVCANNLRVIGQGFFQWAQEHEDNYGWWLPAPSPAATKSQPSWHANLWFQFFWISNELRSPRYLVDPSDDNANLRVATSWGPEPGGLLNVTAKNNAISYFLGVHATPLQPQSILAGDGNIQGGGVVGCSSGIPSTFVNGQYALWPENGHGSRGNLLFNDGKVEMTDTARLKEAVDWNDGWNRHVLKPRVP